MSEQPLPSSAFSGEQQSSAGHLPPEARNAAPVSPPASPFASPALANPFAVHLELTPGSATPTVPVKRPAFNPFSAPNIAISADEAMPTAAPVAPVAAEPVVQAYAPAAPVETVPVFSAPAADTPTSVSALQAMLATKQPAPVIPAPAPVSDYVAAPAQPSYAEIAYPNPAFQPAAFAQPESIQAFAPAPAFTDVPPTPEPIAFQPAPVPEAPFQPQAYAPAPAPFATSPEAFIAQPFSTQPPAETFTAPTYSPQPLEPAYSAQPPFVPQPLPVEMPVTVAQPAYTSPPAAPSFAPVAEPVFESATHPSFAPTAAEAWQPHFGQPGSVPITDSVPAHISEAYVAPTASSWSEITPTTPPAVEPAIPVFATALAAPAFEALLPVAPVEPAPTFAPPPTFAPAFTPESFATPAFSAPEPVPATAEPAAPAFATALTAPTIPPSFTPAETSVSEISLQPATAPEPVAVTAVEHIPFTHHEAGAHDVPPALSSAVPAPEAAPAPMRAAVAEAAPLPEAAAPAPKKEPYATPEPPTDITGLYTNYASLYGAPPALAPFPAATAPVAAPAKAAVEDTYRPSWSDVESGSDVSTEPVDTIASAPKPGRRVIASIVDPSVAEFETGTRSGETALEALPEHPTSYARPPRDPASGFPEPSRRLAASILDGMIISIVVGAVLLMLSLSGMFDWPIAAIIAGGVYLLYGTLFESARCQATPGKMFAGLRVSGKGGTRVSFVKAASRSLTRLVSLLPAGLGYLCVFLSPRSETLHDRLSHTTALVTGPSRLRKGMIIVTGLILALGLSAGYHYYAETDQGLASVPLSTPPLGQEIAPPVHSDEVGKPETLLAPPAQDYAAIQDELPPAPPPPAPAPNGSAPTPQVNTGTLSPVPGAPVAMPQDSAEQAAEAARLNPQQKPERVMPAVPEALAPTSASSANPREEGDRTGEALLPSPTSIPLLPYKVNTEQYKRLLSSNLVALPGNSVTNQGAYSVRAAALNSTGDNQNQLALEFKLPGLLNLGYPRGGTAEVTIDTVRNRAGNNAYIADAKGEMQKQGRMLALDNNGDGTLSATRTIPLRDTATLKDVDSVTGKIRFTLPVGVNVLQYQVEKPKATFKPKEYKGFEIKMGAGNSVTLTYPESLAARILAVIPYDSSAQPISKLKETSDSPTSRQLSFAKEQPIWAFQVLVAESLYSEEKVFTVVVEE